MQSTRTRRIKKALWTVVILACAVGVVTGVNAVLRRGDTLVPNPSQTSAASTPPASAAPTMDTPTSASELPQEPPTTTPAPYTSPTSTQPSPAPEHPFGPAIEAHVDHEGEIIDPTSRFTGLTPQRQQMYDKAEETAKSFMTAFARPQAGITHDQWWANVKPYLDASITETYETVNETRMPYTRVLETHPTVSNAPVSLSIPIRVVTDAGAFSVEVASTENGMKIVAIVFPDTDR